MVNLKVESATSDLLIGPDWAMNFSYVMIDLELNLKMIDYTTRGFSFTRALLGLPAHELHLCGDVAAVPLVQELLKVTGDDIKVHYKFELMQETLYLIVNLIDRFLATEPVIRKKLQLVGITTLLLACKYEEVFVPVVEDLIVIADRAYARNEVLEMETLMVNKLQFNLSVPTAYVFMKRFLKATQSNNMMCRSKQQGQPL